MKQFLNQIFCILALLLVFSCAKKNPATVVIRSETVYDKNNSYNKNKYKKEAPKHVKKESVKTFQNNTEDVISKGSVVIEAGDNIYGIAVRNNIPLRDLILENNIAPPYLLKIGQIVKLPQAKYHQIIEGDTLYSISRSYGMNVNDLVKINNLEEPYLIKLGDKIRVSQESEIVAVAKEPETVIATNESQNDGVAVSNLNDAKKSSPARTEIKEGGILSFKNNHFAWPIDGQVISKFGAKPGGLYNDGINIKATNGDAVKATEDGNVAYVGNELKGYGNLIIVKHSGGWISAYAHLEEAKVKRGDHVKKGDVIAYVGVTGNVSVPQLYFGIRKGREAVNPELYLASSNQSKSNEKPSHVKMKLKSTS